MEERAMAMISLAHPDHREILLNQAKDEMEDMSQVDYVKNLSIVAVTGEIGFERMVGLGGYFLAHGATAEVAFSVGKNWQGKRIGSTILLKLAEAARQNGIITLTAYTLPNNRSMIKLFKKLPYPTKTTFEDNTVVLNCHFGEPDQGAMGHVWDGR